MRDTPKGEPLSFNDMNEGDKVVMTIGPAFSAERTDIVGSIVEIFDKLTVSFRDDCPLEFVVQDRAGNRYKVYLDYGNPPVNRKGREVGRLCGLYRYKDTMTGP